MALWFGKWVCETWEPCCVVGRIALVQIGGKYDTQPPLDPTKSKVGTQPTHIVLLWGVQKNHTRFYALLVTCSFLVITHIASRRPKGIYMGLFLHITKPCGWGLSISIFMCVGTWVPHGMQADVSEYENDMWQNLRGKQFFCVRIESPPWYMFSFLAKCEIHYSFKFALFVKCTFWISWKPWCNWNKYLKHTIWKPLDENTYLYYWSSMWRRTMLHFLHDIR